MPKISDERRAERRTQILEAAWKCFQTQGLHATTMDDIIRGSGLSAGAVYVYFKSKDELIIAALGAAMTGMREMLLPILARRPPQPLDKALVEVAEAILTFSKQAAYDRRKIHILGWGEAQRNANFQSSLQKYYLGFRALLQDAAPSWIVDVERNEGSQVSSAVAKTLLSLMLGFVVQSVVLGDIEPQDLADGLYALGLQPSHD